MTERWQYGVLRNHLSVAFGDSSPSRGAFRRGEPCSPAGGESPPLRVILKVVLEVIVILIDFYINVK